MDRFAAISANIRNLNLVVALHPMLMVLRPGPFLYHIYRKPPVDMDEFKQKVAGYIQMEELIEFQIIASSWYGTKK